MQGRPQDFDATIIKPHVAVQQVDVIQYGKVVDQLTIHAGSVVADRTAAQMRTFEIEVADPNGTLTPDGMTSTLAPFGTRVQLYKGVRISNVEVQAVFYGTTNSWLPSGTSTGVLASTKVDTDGSITLGP
jgi:hypothetical protein